MGQDDREPRMRIVEVRMLEEDFQHLRIIAQRWGKPVGHTLENLAHTIVASMRGFRVQDCDHFIIQAVPVFPVPLTPPKPTSEPAGSAMTSPAAGRAD